MVASLPFRLLLTNNSNFEFHISFDALAHSKLMNAKNESEITEKIMMKIISGGGLIFVS